eukprot:3941174-Rhodomonas_salina.2
MVLAYAATEIPYGTTEIAYGGTKIVLEIAYGATEYTEWYGDLPRLSRSRYSDCNRSRYSDCNRDSAQ